MSDMGIAQSSILLPPHLEAAIKKGREIVANERETATIRTVETITHVTDVCWT